MGFDLFSPIVLDIQIWTSFDPILEWRPYSGLGIGHNMTIKKNWSQKWTTNLEKTTVIEFEIWFLYQSRNIVYKFDPFSAQFHKDCYISKFWKNYGRSNFSPQKIYTVPSLELSIVVWSQNIALKLLWRYNESFTSM